MLGDPIRLHQIILNLVSNAVKFTNKGTITVSVTLLKENKDKVTLKFSIADTGIGIRFSERLVDEFWRVNEIYDSSSDEDVLIELFANAFTSIFKKFDSEIHIANEYASHFQGAERSLIAAEVFADPKLESIWGSPLPDGVYRCEPCLLEYPEFQYGIHAIYRCEDCKEVLDFNSHPVIGEDL